MAEVFIKGKYHESTEEEVLPIHKKLLTGAIVGKNAKEIFFELKGVIENLSRYNHMEELTLSRLEKPSWSDKEVYLNISLNNEIIGSLSLVSVSTMNESSIKRTNIAIFELDFGKLVPLNQEQISLITYLSSH